jgi:membrane-associated progesterone receptor component
VTQQKSNQASYTQSNALSYTMSLSNPLNLLLIPPILYTLYLIIFPTPTRPTKIPRLYAEEHYNWLPAKHPDVICFKQYTPLELQENNGSGEARILLAILRLGRDGKVPAKEKQERTVFDVSAGRGFYGPGG